MMRLNPPGEDATNGARGHAISFYSDSKPPGEDGIERARAGNADELENIAASDAAEAGFEQDEPDIDFLNLVRIAREQSRLYAEQANRQAWSQSYLAFHNEHFIGSKYTKPEYRGRSKLFVPKTRTAVRKDNAAVAASMFNNIDAINCLPGNESDPRQRAAAAVMEELVNYRTDRTSGKAAFPWFLVAMGARQDAVLTGICLTKQYWKQEFRATETEQVLEQNEDTGVYELRERDVYELYIDRPDMLLIPPENIDIDPAAHWVDPIQSASYIIVAWPMMIDEIKAKQNAPVNPWRNDITEAQLRSASTPNIETESVRRSREMGQDRLNEAQTGTEFQIVWVYENFLRVDGEDYTFYSVGDQYYLTDPRPVREVYPEQFGERPLALGYGSLESHRIYPMAPVESWQPLQMETNDLRNLMLDATKQNVMPVAKVRRGRQVDIDQVRRRSSGSSIIVTQPDDVTLETPPQIPQTAVVMARELDLELDDLSGQQNFGSVETNNALGKTLGGLKLAAGAANAVQEFDIRVWIETWATPALAQIVRLEQYYESDAVVLGLCGERAKLFEKYGVNQIDDDLLEQEITVRVSVGLGAGDPQQRLAKFQTAAQIAVPIVSSSPDFQSGKRKVNIEAIIEEIFGAAGYRDGGARFFMEGDPPPPQQDPNADLKMQELKARIAKDERTGQAAYFQGIAALAKVALGKKQLENDVIDMLLNQQGAAQDRQFDQADRRHRRHMDSLDMGHRHGLELAGHRRNLSNDQRSADRAQTAAQAALAQSSADGGAGTSDGSAAGQAARPEMPPPGPVAGPSGLPSAPLSHNGDPRAALMALMQSGQLQFTRDPRTGRIAGVRLPQQALPAPQESAA